MSIPTVFRMPRRAPLTSCLAGVLGLALSVATGRELPASSRTQARDALLSGLNLATVPWPGNIASESKGMPRTVSSCVDDGNPGSLRYEVEHAASGDTIDLSALMCSTITLGSEIKVAQNDLKILGWGSAYLTLDGNGHSRIFNHTANNGTLAIYDLTLANGYYASNGNAAKGGCIIASATKVRLVRSVVTHCTVLSTSSDLTAHARGGGIFASYLTSLGSTITENKAYAYGGGSGSGAGAFVGGLYSKYSLISHNKSLDDRPSCSSDSAGIASQSTIYLKGTTISENSACGVGAIWIGGNGTASTIINSTISGNSASNLDAVGGIVTNRPLKLLNSTVAFNRARGGTGGVFLSQDAALTLQSSIVADNIAAGKPSDVNGTAGASIGGTSDNLVIASTLPLPMGTRLDCPKLNPLVDNGGGLPTHALMETSPAIDQGDNDANLDHDQRSAPRVAGAAADIGAYERQPGEKDERLLVSGFDGLCDQ